MKNQVSQEKANKILEDKSIKGHPLTDKQRRFFGAMASGEKMKQGTKKEERSESKKEATAEGDYGHTPKMHSNVHDNTITDNEYPDDLETNDDNFSTTKGLR